MADPNDKKIIIDSDWKEEAQREKEQLAAALEAEKRQKERPPIEANFPVLLETLAVPALIALGEMENPGTGKREANPPAARLYIDLLEVIEEKTKGNLSPDEAQMLKALLFDLRMRFVNRQAGAK
jgi:hypothetical protein